MEQLAKFPVTMIDDLLDYPGSRMEIAVKGQIYEVSCRSLRYKTFRKSISCECCGIKGKHMILELPDHTDVPHFNLYAVDDAGRFILMTKDHVIPRSKGGKDTLENMTTLCEICNCTIKQDKCLSIEELRKLRANHDKEIARLAIEAETAKMLAGEAKIE